MSFGDFQRNSTRGQQSRNTEGNSSRKSNDLAERASRFGSSSQAIKVGRLVLGMAIAWLIYKSLAVVLEAVEDFNPDPFNGTFQLLAAARRLLSSTTFGSDYVVFHGPLWAAPTSLSLLLGQDPVATAHFSKLLVGTISGPLGIGLVTYFFSRPGPIRLYLTALGIVISTNWEKISFGALGEMSMLGWRLACGFLTIVLIYLAYRQRNFRRKSIVSACASLAVLSATDYGLYAFVGGAAGLFITGLLNSQWRHRGPSIAIRQVGNVILIPFLVLTFSSLFLFVLAKGSWVGFSASIRFYFVDLPGDQKWFFGGWPVDTISSWVNLVSTESLILLVVFLTGSLTAPLFFRRKLPQRLNYAILALSLSSLLSLTSFTTSYLSDHYLYFARLSLIAIALLVFDMALVRLAGLNEFRATPKSQTKSTLLFCGLGVALLTIPALLAPLTTSSDRWIRAQKSALTLGAVCTQGSAVSPTWSLYPGLPQSTGDGCFSPVGDLAIHALGSRRAAYLSAFLETRPPLVETPRGDRFRHEPWLRSTLFPLYWELWRTYEPAGENDDSIFWRRGQERDWTPLKTDSFQFQEGRWVARPAPPDAVGVVTVHYRIENPMKGIPLLGNLSGSSLKLGGTTFDSLGGYVSRSEEIPLDPRTTKVTFAIQENACPSTVSFEVDTQGLNPWQTAYAESATLTWYEKPEGELWDLYFGPRWPDGTSGGTQSDECP